jgi:hypothetical protein
MNDADVIRAAASVLHDHDDVIGASKALQRLLASTASLLEDKTRDGGVPCTAGLFTRDEVSTAVNNGVDLVSGGVGLSDSGQDLLNLVVNAAMSALDDPAVTLDVAIASSYDEDPETVKGWAEG